MRLLRLIAGIVLVSGILVGAGASTARDLYKKAARAEKDGDAARAYILYAEAAALDPEGRTNAWARSLALRRAALTSVDTLAAGIEAAGGDLDEEPLDNRFLGVIGAADILEAERMAPPAELEASGDIHSFALRGTARQLYGKVADAYGLEVVYDGDFEDGKPLRLSIEDAGYREALHILQAATNTFIIPVSSGMFMVAEDSSQKRQDLEHNMAVVIPIPETVSVQEAQELSTAVRQTMEIKQLVIDSQRRMVLIRDRVSRVKPAQDLFEELMRSRPEVIVEVDFLEFKKTGKTRYGITLPASAPLVWLGDLWGNLVDTASLASNIATFGGGATLIGLGIGNAELIASMSHSNARSLLHSELRSVSGQQATLHVGDRYPIQTQGYMGDTSGTETVYRPPPTISFEDLGVVVKVTPYVHDANDVTLEIETEFKVLTGQALNGIPVISNRAFQGTARLREGEWAVVTGFVKSSEMRAVTGLAGLSQIPYLGALFRKTAKETETGETLLVLKPRLVRLPASEYQTRPVWTGTETKPKSPI